MHDREASAEVLAVLAHGLRNPLSVLVGYAELLRMRDDSTSRLEAIERIVEAADEVAFAADDVLALLALELDAVELSAEPVSLGEMTRVGVERAARRAPGFRFVPASAFEHWPVVRGDVAELPRVLADVLVAACSVPAAPGHVDLAARASKSVAEVHVVAPAGEGAAVGVERMFERAARSPANGDVRASGLELHMARRYLDLHGGGLRTEPQSDGRFGLVVTLPLAPVAA